MTVSGSGLTYYSATCLQYVYLEELLGNVAGARQVFERWMQWEPAEEAWSAYIKMEIRYHELGRASNVYERLVSVHPEPKIWIRWAKFEEEQRGNVDRAREVRSEPAQLPG